MSRYKAKFREFSGASHLYSDAGHNAPPEIKQGIERFRNLPMEQRARKPLLYYLLGSGTPPYKLSPRDADYQQSECSCEGNSGCKHASCGNCHFFYMKMSNQKTLCSWVRGSVVARGWCKYWMKADEISPAV